MVYCKSSSRPLAAFLIYHPEAILADGLGVNLLGGYMGNENKFTTGEWIIEPIRTSGKGKHSRFETCITAGDKIVAKKVWPFSGAPVAEANEGYANMVLIANAPTLLSMLECISNKISPEALRSIQHCGQLGVYFSALEINNLRAAIAKAKGGPK